MVGEQDPPPSSVIAEYVARGLWEEALYELERQAELSSGSTRAGYYLHAGEILLSEVGHPEEAIRQFHLAHEADPSDMRAIQGLESAHRALDDDARLVQSYHEALERIPAGDRKLAVRLWVKLAEVYLTGLGSRDDGAAALEHAVSLEPHDETRRRVLLELYRRDPIQPQHEVPHLRALAASDRFGEESLRTLFTYQSGVGPLDGAYAAASALEFLKRASSDEREFLAQHQREGKPSQPMDGEAWRLARPRGESRLIAFVFALTARAIADMYKVNLRKKVKAADRIDVTTSPINFCRRLAAAHFVLGVPLPEVYRLKERTGIRYVHSGTPVLLVGENVLSGRSKDELAFLAAKHLAYMRTEYYPLRVAHGDIPTLRALFLAVLRVANPSLSLPPEDVDAVEALQPGLEERLGAGERDRIRSALITYRGDLPVIDMESYVQASERAASRLGLLLAGGLQPAVGAALKEVRRVSNLAIEDLVKDLVRYSVSGEFLQLCEAVGLPPVEPVAPLLT